MVRKKVLFRHNNAPSHTSGIVREKLDELRFQIVFQPAHSANLDYSDFHLFPTSNVVFVWRKFKSEGVITQVEHYFDDLDADNNANNKIESLP